MCENFKTWIVPLSLKTWHSKLEEPLSQEGRKTWQWRLFVQSDDIWIMLLGWKQGGRGLRQASAMLHQSPYVNQLVCAVGGVLVFIAKSEWRGGEQKKWKKWNLTCLVNATSTYLWTSWKSHYEASWKGSKKWVTVYSLISAALWNDCMFT